MIINPIAEQPNYEKTANLHEYNISLLSLQSEEVRTVADFFSLY